MKKKVAVIVGQEGGYSSALSALFGTPMPRPPSKQPLVGIDAVRQAVDEGKAVHWMNDRYTLVKDRHGQYLVGWDVGGRQENWVRLDMERHGDDGYYYCYDRPQS